MAVAQQRCCTTMDIKEVPITHKVDLRWEILSEFDYESPHLAIEDAEQIKIRFNGEVIIPQVDGLYVDKAIKTISLLHLKQGVNFL